MKILKAFILPLMTSVLAVAVGLYWLQAVQLPVYYSALLVPIYPLIAFIGTMIWLHFNLHKSKLRFWEAFLASVPVLACYCAGYSLGFAWSEGLLDSALSWNGLPVVIGTSLLISVIPALLSALFYVVVRGKPAQR